MSDNDRLKQIKTIHHQACTNWQTVIDGSEQLIVTGIDAADGETTDLAIICADNPADEQILKNAHGHIGFLLELLRKAFGEIRHLKANQQVDNTPPNSFGREKNYAANCAIQCQDPAFKKFLQVRHGLLKATDENTAKKVRELCGIASRKLLNTDTQKAEIWVKLNREFQEWGRHG